MTASLTRRGFLAAGTAALALPGRPAAATGAGSVLRAAVSDLQLLPTDYPRTRIWGYEGTMPGPEIRVVQGARIRRRLVNDLPQATSVHWHGVRIDNAMDGVAGLTQPAVARGDSFDYDFTVPDAGTYWYHAHNRSFEQVARGLYGALIVEEPDPLDIDREEVLILDDWRLDPDTGQIVDGFPAMHDASHAGRIGNFTATNSIYNLSLPAKRHERLRLRLINAANARVFPLRLDGMTGWIVALDGMPLPAPRPVDDLFQLAPAQRIDLIVDITADDTAHLVVEERRGSYSQVAFEVTGTAASVPRAAPVALPPNAVGAIDLAAARAVMLHMEGGAMGGMAGAMMNGERRSARDMMMSGMFWAFNGAVGTMDAPPLVEAAQGETIRMTLRNDTAFAHAMHLHGMHFHEIGTDETIGDLRDTTLVQPGETRDIAFVADNPGNWLLHCHMLSHAATGMMSRIVVS